MKEHELKIDKDNFELILKGFKTFEIRYNDRDFQTYDVLILRETEYSNNEMKNGKPLKYTDRILEVDVMSVLKGPAYGLKENWVVMSIKKLSLRDKKRGNITVFSL